MVVRIRFGRGPVVSRRKGKNGRLAVLAASLLTMLSVSFASLGMWRLGADLGWTGNFVVEAGFLSHWLVWLGLAAAAQYTSWRLAGYAALSGSRDEANGGEGDFGGASLSRSRNDSDNADAQVRAL